MFLIRINVFALRAQKMRAFTPAQRSEANHDRL